MSDIHVASPYSQVWLSATVLLVLGQWRRFGIVCGGAAFGWGFFATWTMAIEYSNSNELCVTCHVVKDTVFKKSKETKPSKNESGLRADCHVFRYNWIAEGETKVGTLQALYTFFFGGNADYFRIIRPYLAKGTGAKFVTSNARECLHCHDYNDMALEDQTRTARSTHQTAMTTNRNCIDCHRGITPKNYDQKTVEPAQTVLKYSKDFND